ncbi:MAG: ion channel [Promethearchaeota archaeon]
MTGFGDLYPITTTDRLVTFSFAFLGVSLFTLPAGILYASFFNGMKEFYMYLICPKCGFVISKPKLSKKCISILFFRSFIP